MVVEDVVDDDNMDVNGDAMVTPVCTSGDGGSGGNIEDGCDADDEISVDDLEYEMEYGDNEMFREEFGEVYPPCRHGPAFVFSQGWPSWSFAADALGFMDIHTCVDWPNAVAREEFRSTPLGSTLKSRTLVRRLLDDHDKLTDFEPSVFIQGDASFLESTLALFRDIPCRLQCAVVRNLDGSFLSPKSVRHIPGFYWRCLSHKGMGGVTTGTWLLGSTVNLAPVGGLKLSSLRRSLRHVLKTTVRGVDPSVLPDPTRYLGHKVLSPKDRAPFGQPTFVVDAPCVFSKNKTVVREATIRELLDVYDVELSVQDALHDFWDSSGVTPSRSFVHQAPVKVLLGPGLQLLRALDPPRPSEGDLDVPVPDILLQNEVSDPSSPPSSGVDMGLAGVSPTTDASSPTVAPNGHPRFGMEQDELGASSLPSEQNLQAVKHDDAEVNVEDWDVWTVNSYRPPDDSDDNKPKICIPGTYSPAHTRHFGFLRRLMLRAYKRRLLRGFLKFLNLEHDGGSRVPIPVSYRLVDDDGGVISTISATARVSPWCLSKLPKRLPRRRGKRSRSGHPNEDLLRDLIRGADCLERAGKTTFWEWCDGSSIFFWQWPARYKRALRDGTKLFVHWKHLPTFTDPQRLPKDPEIRDKLLKKVQVPRSKRYIVPGNVKSKTGFFPVPKGENDIRIVYDATACGLNRALWSPNFYLPTIDSLLRNADEHTYYGDIDLGEMFLNYALDEALHPYAGVDVSGLEPEKVRAGVKQVIERWERTLMGLRPSPYVCTQAFSWSEEVIRGNRLDEKNPLRWDKVILNLPGDPAYDPTKPRVYKWNSITNTMAGSFGTYVDDIRTQHQSEALCRAVTRTVASGAQYLGQQDAPRKRRPPAKRPGAWSGAMCFSVEGEGLYVTCAEKKWNKGKDLIWDLYNKVVREGATELDRKALEKGVGFLVHLSRTYPAIFPYLKGIYLTMESWRIGRDAEGWKFSRKAWWNLMAGALEDDEEVDEKNEDGLSFEEKRRNFLYKNEGKTPKLVKISTRLSRDLTALVRLFDHEKPPKRLVRGNKLKKAQYSFGDASGGGFGSSWESDGKVKYRAGTWGMVMTEESSNHRELRNLVDSLKVMEKEGSLRGTEAFIFTDNTTAEAAFYKGTSTSRHLFELVMELRELEMRAGCKISIIHVAGTRMIEQGSDGLSRGNFTEGSMKSGGILDYVPLAESAIDRSPGLLPWIRKWVLDDNLEILDPIGWFERGHDLVQEGTRNSEGHWIPKYRAGTFLWTPPPAAGDVAVEELRKARHKRQDSTHIFMVPSMMKPMWNKQLCKAADIVLTLPAGHAAWPSNMHESLTIGICFPYLKHRPWELRRSKKLLELGRSLSRVWKGDPGTEGPILRELWSLPGRLADMSSYMACKVLQGISESSLSHRRARK